MDINININTNNEKTVLVQNNEFTSNELEMTACIQNIPYNNFYFSTLIDFSYMNFKNIGDNGVTTNETNYDDKKWMLFVYNEKNSYVLTSFLLKQTNKNKIFYYVNSLKNIVKGLIILKNNDLFHLNISPNSILYLENTEYPVLSKFRYCVEQKNTEIISKIINSFEQSKLFFQPYEIWLHFYLKNNKSTEETTIDYLLHMSNIFKTNNYNNVNNDKIDFHCDSLGNIYLEKIEVYSLSLVYLHVLSKSAIDCSEIPSEIISILKKNLNIDPLKRSSLDEIHKTIDALI